MIVLANEDRSQAAEEEAATHETERAAAVAPEQAATVGRQASVVICVELVKQDFDDLINIIGIFTEPDGNLSLLSFIIRHAVNECVIKY